MMETLRPTTRRYRLLAMAASLLLLVCIALSVTCTSLPASDGEKRLVALVNGLASDVILPTFDDLAARTGLIKTAVSEFANDPNQARLATAQAAWRSARISLKESEAFAFGPAMDLRIGVAMDQSPIDTSKVDGELAGTAVLNDNYIETLGANSKGFHALEYLLFRGNDDAAVLASLTTEPLAARRREFLLAASQNVERKAIELKAAWTVTDGGYVSLLTAPGSLNSTYPTIKTVIDTLINECVFLSEIVANNKLGKPLGTAAGGVPQPALEESAASDNSVADMLGNLHGIRNIYLATRSGGAGGGFSELVASRSPETDQAVQDALGKAIAAVERIPRPFNRALVEKSPEVTAAYEAVKTLKRVLATELVGVLGVTLKFNDNDGD